MYDDFRRLLGDELGIEPSPALIAQHADLLDRHWSSDVEPDEQAAHPGHVARRTRRTRGRCVGDGGGAPPGDARVVQAASASLACSTKPGLRLREMHPDRSVVLCELAAADEDPPSTRSPRRWGSKDDPMSDWSTGSPPCSATRRSSCCSTTASTSSSRSPSSCNPCSRRVRTSWIVTTSRERLRVGGRARHRRPSRCQRCRRPPTTPRPCNCSSHEHRPWILGSIPTRRR